MWKKILFAGLIIFPAILAMFFYIFMHIIYIPEDENEQNQVFYEIVGENTKVNVSPALDGEKIVGGFKFSDIKLNQNDDILSLTAKVTNISGKDTSDFTYFKITFIDGRKEVVDHILGIIDPVADGSSAKLDATIQGITDSFLNSYDIIFEVTDNPDTQAEVVEPE